MPSHASEVLLGNGPGYHPAHSLAVFSLVICSILLLGSCGQRKGVIGTSASGSGIEAVSGKAEIRPDTSPVTLFQSFPLSRKVHLPALQVKCFVDHKFFILNDAPDGQWFISMADTALATLPVQPVSIPMHYRTLLRRHKIPAAQNEPMFLAEGAFAGYWAPRLIAVKEHEGHIHEYFRLHALGHTYELPGHAGDSTLLLNAYDFLEVDGRHRYYIDRSSLYHHKLSYEFNDLEPMREKLLFPLFRSSMGSADPDKPLFATFALNEDSVFVTEHLEACQLPALYDSIGKGYENSMGPIHNGIKMPVFVPLVFVPQDTAYHDHSEQLTGRTSIELLRNAGTEYFMSDFRAVGSSILTVYEAGGKYYVAEIDRGSGSVHSKRRLEGDILLDSILFISDMELLGLSADGLKLLRWRI
jgi:hypothetical protein